MTKKKHFCLLLFITRFFVIKCFKILVHFSVQTATPLKQVSHLFPSNPPLKIETLQSVNLANIYLLKVNNRNAIKRCEICSKLTIKTPRR